MTKIQASQTQISALETLIQVFSIPGANMLDGQTEAAQLPSSTALTNHASKARVPLDKYCF